MGFSRYANLHGNSGVRSYQILYDDQNAINGIIVQFLGRAEYTYTIEEYGSATIQAMVNYARGGWYLQRFINATFGRGR